jgi:glycosyltransferase involved in cell wall biosynthesis
MMEQIRDTLTAAGLGARLHMTGILTADLADAYAAMDVFAFSSQSETQGLVLAEAMAAGIPVVALDAPGAREVVMDGHNGRLLPADASSGQFADALDWLASRNVGDRKKLREAAIHTSRLFSRDITTQKALALYASLCAGHTHGLDQDNGWQAAKRSLGEEYKILRNLAHAISDAVLTTAP